MPTSDYFPGYQSVGVGDEADSEPRRRQVDPDTLPFNHLSGRRFEILAWEMKRALPMRAGDLVRLMQGTGERGRDLLVFDAQRKLRGIVQCKRQASRVDLTSTIQALAKVALHYSLKPSVLGGEVIQFELWSSSGFTEPAAELLDGWPASWTEDAVRPHVVTLLAEFAAFKGLTWDLVRDSVMRSFPSRVEVRGVDGLEITAQLRDLPEVHARFFEVLVAASQDQVDAAVEKTMARNGLVLLSGKDVAHIVERVQSVPAADRLFFGQGYLLGMRPAMIASMTAEQVQSLTVDFHDAVFKPVMMVAEMGKAKVREILARDVPLVPDRLPNFVLLFRQLLMAQMVSMHEEALLPAWARSNTSKDYSSYTQEEAIDWHVHQLWDEAEACLATDPTTDPEAPLRHAIARAMQQGYADRAALEARAAEAFTANAGIVFAAIEELRGYMPTTLIMISDTESFLDRAESDPAVLDRYHAMIEATKSPAGEPRPLASDTDGADAQRRHHGE
ncbi:MAG: hypothetical protein V7645_3070 [Actinomycetota bacterium]